VETMTADEFEARITTDTAALALLDHDRAYCVTAGLSTALAAQMIPGGQVFDEQHMAGTER
jgi:hypothetical protein